MTHVMNLRTPEAFYKKIEEMVRAPLAGRAPDLTGLGDVDMMNLSIIMGGMLAECLRQIADDDAQLDEMVTIIASNQGAESVGAAASLWALAERVDSGLEL